MNSREGEPQVVAEQQLGTTGEVPTTEAGRKANELLALAQTKMTETSALSAELRQLFVQQKQKFFLSGRYQQADSLRFRIQTRGEIGNTSTDLLQVSDGQILWTQKEVDSPNEATEAEQPNITVTRRNLEQILSVAVEAEPGAMSTDQLQLALGGLPTLLKSLSYSYSFSLLDETEQIYGVPCDVLQGRLKPVGDGETPPAAGAPIEVRLSLDQQQHFPLRIVYRLDGRQFGGEKGDAAYLVTEFTNIRFGAEIEPDLFTYTPPSGVVVRDVTRDVIAGLENAQVK